MKTILFYNGKTGFTKQYADWIGEETGCEVKPFKDFAKAEIGAEDLVIFGSRVHAGRVSHLNKVKARLSRNLIVFAVGAVPATAENVIAKMWSENLTESEIETIPHFYMQGGVNYEKMGAVDRTILKGAAKLMSGKKEKTEEEMIFGDTLKASFDATSKESIEPLVKCIKEKNQESIPGKH